MHFPINMFQKGYDLNMEGLKQWKMFKLAVNLSLPHVSINWADYNVMRSMLFSWKRKRVILHWIDLIYKKYSPF